MKKNIFGATALIFLFITSLVSQTAMKPIKGGTYVPLYGNDSMQVYVDDFSMDIFPVTNQQYLQFVKANPQWQRSQIKKLFADKMYLYTWEADTILNITAPLEAPVTNVSWFAAKAYCQYYEKRLPTIDEWEYVGMANEKLKDARPTKGYNEYILAWYEKPRNEAAQVGTTFKNYWGIYDMHGLVWEWTLDFNAVLMSGESRKDVDTDSDLFCGSASLGTTDLMNYAAFMRYAIRGSLKAKYTMKNLGFRCVKEQ
jgi:formylglycine-generating enzyme required for sulfatase activity